MTKVSALGKEYVQAAKNSKAKSKELAKELRETRRYERDSKILSIYGVNPETGKRSAGKLIGMTLLTSPLWTVYFCNKADKIQMQREIAELKGEVAEHRKSSEIIKDKIAAEYGVDPETGKRNPFVYLSAFPGALGVGTILPYVIAADKINANKAAAAAETAPEGEEAIPASEAVEE